MDRSLVWRLTFAGMVFAVLAVAVVVMDWRPYDWELFLRPAALEWQQPYRPGVSNPPWLFAVLHPLARLPPREGHLILVAVSMAVLVACIRVPVNLLMVLLSAPFWVVVLEGQVDGLAFAAFLLPVPLTLAVAAVKPQGLWLAGIWRGGWPAAVVLALILVLSLLLWPNWWAHFRAPSRGVGWWPWSIAPGLVLALVSWQRRSPAGLCAASLLLSPYWNWSSLLPLVTMATWELRGLSLFALPLLSWAMILLLR